jgi:hypothetical protein
MHKVSAASSEKCIALLHKLLTSGERTLLAFYSIPPPLFLFSQHKNFMEVEKLVHIDP